MEAYKPFLNASPVWAEGMQERRHTNLGLYASFETSGEQVLLRLTTSGYYRVFVNGSFAFYGPARCAHGFFRVDEVTLQLPAGKAHIAIEVVNYYIRSFDQLRQPGFIQAELVAGERVLAATGAEGFATFLLTERVRKVPRYSYQRPAAEGWCLAPEHGAWRVGKSSQGTEPVSCTQTEEKTLVPRRLPLNTFPHAYPERLLSRGSFCIRAPEKYRTDWWANAAKNKPDNTMDDFPKEDLQWNITKDVQEFATDVLNPCDGPYSGETAVTDGSFEILRLKCEKTGFIQAHICCEQPGSLYFLVDETLRETGDVDPTSMECCNALRLDMQPGSYDFLAMNPIGFRFIKVLAHGGSFRVSGLCVKELICPQPVVTDYPGQDTDLAAVFEAAKETFLQNSSDLFMDCPTRERAGWLCDSYFTARAEKLFTGKNVVERNYLENYLLPDSYPDIPEGMFPMNYPCDHANGSFIPNWGMWLVLELEDLLFNRDGDREFVMAFREKVYKLIDYFKQFENADGLLEKLKGWVFLEWSMANKLVQDINFPSNMLYARMLEAAGRLYDDPALMAKAADLKAVIRKRSFDGSFFTDNEVYQDGVPVSTGQRTETCQYYAFFCGVATPDTYPALWHTLLTDFGPQRAETGAYPEIHPANAFIGNYLRLCLMEDNGLYEQLLKEVKGYFCYMAERTGTLWENITDHASCNHGFASYAAHFIYNAAKLT